MPARPTQAASDANCFCLFWNFAAMGLGRSESPVAASTQIGIVWYGGGTAAQWARAVGRPSASLREAGAATNEISHIAYILSL